MVNVQPLHGLRYSSEVVGDLALVVSPPYDVVSPEEQAYYHALSSYNIIHLELGKEVSNEDNLNNRYYRAKATLTEWCANGVLVRDPTARYYLYQQVFEVGEQKYTRTGLLARVRLEPWNSRAVLAHEYTMSKPLNDRLNLLRATATNISPIMCLYDDPEGRIRKQLTPYLSRDDIQVIDKIGEKHLLYSITEAEQIKFIHSFFLNKQLYIADGHHRYETALNYREEIQAQRSLPFDDPANFVLMTLVDIDDPGLVILPTHRLLSHLNERTLEAFTIENVSRYFRVQKLQMTEDRGVILERLAASGRHNPSLVVSTAEDLWLLNLNESGKTYMTKSGHSMEWNELEVAVAQKILIEEMLGISAGDTVSGTNLTYVHDAEIALQSVKSGKAQVAILLNTPSVKQLCDVVKAGDIMPPKSTYFYPKLLTGLVMNPLT